MKGLGSKIPATNWVRTDDGKYALLDIPIFSLVDDEIKGVKFTEEKAKEAVRIFNNDAKRGFFPRVFVGHHDGSTAQRKGLGFLDSVRLAGNTIFAHIVDLTLESFTLFKNNVFPYRSVEYNDSRNLITGLAVLESQMPFFRFSNINLSEKPLINFSLNNNVSRSFYMADEKPVADVQNPVQPEKPVEEEKVPAWAKEIKDLLTQLVNMEIEEKKEREKASQMSADAANAASQVGKQPGSVAMQLTDPVNSSLLSMKKELEDMKREKKYHEKLQVFCEENGMDFGTHKDILSKFSNDVDRDSYMTMLTNQAFSLASHRMSDIAKGYKNVPLDEQNKLVQKYPAHQKVVREAIKTFNETMNHPDSNVSKMFSASFKDLSTFVDIVIMGTKSDPDYLSKMTISE